MASQLVIDILTETFQGAIRKAATVSGVGHTGVRGRFRELFLNEVLRPLFPNNWVLATGIIVDKDDQRWESTSGDSGGQSGQEDILIINPELLPPILLQQEQVIAPIESVVGVVEVKSKLTATELDSSIKHAMKIRELVTSWELIHAEGPSADDMKWTKYPGYHLFAFDSDLNEKSEKERFDERAEKLKVGDDSPFLSMCVANKTVLKWSPFHEVTELSFLEDAKMFTDVAMCGWVMDLVDVTKMRNDIRNKFFQPAHLTGYLE